jgi:hypothetical protein
MKFTVYQINLSDKEYDVRNVREMYLDTIMNPTADAIVKARQLYKPVADIEALGFNDVFDIGNIGPEEKITRKARMHSVSVGDVIVREDGETKFVAPYSFESVAF